MWPQGRWLSTLWPVFVPQGATTDLPTSFHFRASLVAAFTMICSELRVCGKLSQCGGVKACGKMEVSLSPFPASTVDGSRSSASRPGRFTFEDRAPGTYWMGSFVVSVYGCPSEFRWTLWKILFYVPGTNISELICIDDGVCQFVHFIFTKV